MSILESILEGRATKFDAPVHPQDPVIADIFGLDANTAAGVTVTQNSALKMSAVFACIRNISEDVAKLPLGIFRRLDRGKEKLRDHPLFALLHDSPNEDMSSFDFRETVQGWALSWGNGYAEIERNRAGRAIAIRPLPSVNVEPDRDAGGRLFYRLLGDGRIIESENMFHLRGLGGDGIVGWSIIRLARETIGLALGQEQFSARFFSNNAQPGGWLEHPAALGSEAFARLKESIAKRQGGLENAHRPMILEEGMKWHGAGIPADDAQLVQSREFSIEDVARWYRMPPHKIQQLLRATFSNVVEQNIEYVVDTLMPWIARWEQEIRRKVLPVSEPTWFAQHSVQGLLRGDPKTRSEFYRTLLNIGVLTPNDILDFEDMNPYDGGDEHYLQLNMAPVTALPAIQQNGDRALRGRIAAAHKDLLADAFGRAIRVEADKIRQASERPDFKSWCRTFYDGHVAHTRRQLGGPVDAAAESIYALVGNGDMTEADRTRVMEFTASLAGEHCRTSCDLVMTATSVDQTVSGWDGERTETEALRAVDGLVTLVGTFNKDQRDAGGGEATEQ